MRRAAAIALAVACSFAGCRREEELPVLATVPDFTLTDQAGRSVRGHDFDGEPFIADFMFTRCTSACPMLTAQMANVQRRLGARADRVRMVSFTVDPEHDTPEVLAEFARAHGTTHRWTYLTGDAAGVRETAVRGFRVGIGDPTEIAGGGLDILHAQHLILVDAQRRIRGYFRTDREGMEALDRAVSSLLSE